MLSDVIPYFFVLAILIYTGFRFYYLFQLKSFSKLYSLNTLRITIANPIYLRIRILLYCLIVALAFFAYYYPLTEDMELPNEGSGVDILFIVDTSLSMNAVDVSGGRLSRFKQIILPMLPELEGNRLGLLVYAGSPFLYCPLTSDLEAFSDFVKGLDTDMVGDKGTDIGKVLNKAKAILSSNKILRHRILVLISDGEDHENASIPTIDEKLLVWGIGSVEGSPIYYQEEETSTSGYVTINGTLSPLSSGEDIVISKANLELLNEIAMQNRAVYHDLTRNASSAFELVDLANSISKNKLINRSTFFRFQKVHYFLLPMILILFLDVFLIEFLIYRKVGSNG